MTADIYKNLFVISSCFTDCLCRQSVKEDAAVKSGFNKD